MALDTSNLKVYLRGTDLSTSLQSTSLEQTREEIDTTVFASTIRTPQATFASVAMAHAGLYEDGAFTLGEVFRQAHAADVEPFTICPVGPAVGSIAFLVLAHSAGLTLPDQMAPGQVVRASIRASGRAPIPTNGQVTFNGPISISGQHTAVQLGAPLVTQQIVATIHLLDLTPTPSVTFVLESDTAVGFPSPTVQQTSAAQIARGSLVLQAAGPTPGETWWRVRWTFTGTGSFTALIALGLSG